MGEAQGKMLGQSMDNWVAVPLTAFLQSYGSHATMDIYLDSGGGGAITEVVEDQLRSIMRARRHLAPSQEDTFTIDTSATFQNLLGKILNSFGAVVAAIASISLVVGGIVIMNIMLVSVTERTREIGVRKALGARRRDILLQFLVESATMSLVGASLASFWELARPSSSPSSSPSRPPCSCGPSSSASSFQPSSDSSSASTPRTRPRSLTPSSR